MRVWFRSLMATVIAATALILFVPEATAGQYPSNLSVDVNGDGVADHLTLFRDNTGCTATVQLGLRRGGFRAPERHEYALPNGRSPYDCPDMAVALPSPSGPELVLAGAFDYPGVLYVMRHYRIVETAPGENEPSEIGTQDFDGDGRPDIWQSTDQGGGVQTFLQRDNTFVPGPAVPHLSGHSEPVFGQLDNRPGTDMAFPYFPFAPIDGVPGSGGPGVLVVFGGSGKKVVLQHDVARFGRCSVQLVQANRDRWLDVRVLCMSGDATTTRTYLNDGLGHFHLAR